jgi:hypothetical protein
MTRAGQYKAEIEATCRSLEEHFEMLYEKCVTAAQKGQLRNTYSAARYASWKADEWEAVVDEGDHLESAYNELKVTNTRIKTMLKNVDDIAVFLYLAAEAVRLAEFPGVDRLTGT